MSQKAKVFATFLPANRGASTYHVDRGKGADGGSRVEGGPIRDVRVGGVAAGTIGRR